jgi:hypothetical protein
MGHIYIFTFPHGKQYVGFTKDPYQRFKEHKSAAKRGKNYPLYCAIRKYGWENVKKEVVMSHPDAEWVKTTWEPAFIKVLDTQATGYNLTAGGEGVLDPSPEVRRKMGDPKRGKPAWNRGKKMTDDQLVNMRANQPDRSGTKNPAARRVGLVDIRTGHLYTFDLLKEAAEFVGRSLGTLSGGIKAGSTIAKHYKAMYLS